jgi:hypothetical protein
MAGGAGCQPFFFLVREPCAPESPRVQKLSSAVIADQDHFAAIFILVFSAQSDSK